MNEFDFEGTVWHYRNPNTVYFVSLPEELSAELLALFGTALNPWGTVPVDATIGNVTWYTSMFPRDNGRYYDMPLKLEIMKRLGLVDDQLVAVHIAVRVPW